MREERGNLSQGPEQRIILERASILEGANVVDVHGRDEAAMGRCQLSAETARDGKARRTRELRSWHGRWR